MFFFRSGSHRGEQRAPSNEIALFIAQSDRRTPAIRLIMSVLDIDEYLSIFVFARGTRCHRALLPLPWIRGPGVCVCGCLLGVCVCVCLCVVWVCVCVCLCVVSVCVCVLPCVVRVCVCVCV